MDEHNAPVAGAAHSKSSNTPMGARSELPFNAQNTSSISDSLLPPNNVKGPDGALTDESIINVQSSVDGSTKESTSAQDDNNNDASGELDDDEEDDVSSYECAASEADEEFEKDSSNTGNMVGSDGLAIDAANLESSGGSDDNGPPLVLEHGTTATAQAGVAMDAAATAKRHDDDDRHHADPQQPLASVAEFNQVLLTPRKAHNPVYNAYWKLHLATISEQAVADKSFVAPLLKSFRSYLEAESDGDFLHLCRRAGLIDPAFTWREPSQALQDKFLQAGPPLAGASRAHVKFGLVFHGTRQFNIESILQNGLDPKRRAGQDYGAGEYFGMEPGISLSYCQGGCRMLVFCIVATEQQPERQLPMGYALVEENSYQIPLGVLSFSSATQSAMNRSNSLRAQLRTLATKASKSEKLAKEARLKSAVLQFIFQREFEVAATSFKKAYDHFSMDSKLEIGYYAYQAVDDAFVDYYFDGKLPERSACSWDRVKDKIKSVEHREKEADTAWGEVNETFQKMNDDASGDDEPPVFGGKRMAAADNSAVQGPSPKRSAAPAGIPLPPDVHLIE